MNIDAATTSETLRECAEKVWGIGLAKIVGTLSIHPGTGPWAKIVVRQTS
jgi:hypothetical protein